jgi:pyruvate dehydrogenase E1 component alpha subunit
MFDLARRFMGGYGIVGGNLPIAAGIALASDYQGTDEVTLCTFGDGASNQGTFGETLNIAALWRLPVVFMVTNNQFGMGTALRRHSAVTDLQRKGESLGVPGMRCDGMDVLDTHAVLTEAVRRVREDREPVLVEAITYRFRGHSMADPEQYRTKEEVARWRERDPLPAFAELLLGEGVIEESEREQIDQEALERVDAAVEFAEASPFPTPESLYDDVYVLPRSGTGELEVRGWYSVATTEPGAGEPAGDGEEGARVNGAAPAANDEIPQQLTDALAAGEDGREALRAAEPQAGDGPGAVAD